MCSFFRRLIFALALLVPANASAQPLQWFWWKTEPTKSELALTADQSTQIEVIFQDGIARLRTEKDELDRLESKLSRLIETMTTEAQITQQIDRVEAVRSNLNKTRTLMLLHMRQLLTPDQRAKLNALRDRREQEQRDARDKNDKNKDPRKRAN